MDTTNILIVGVGGQGTLLTSRVIGKLAVELGYDVKLSEVHGMAQRGGSVVTHVRMGKKVYSPLIEEGQSDFILAFEKMEALRWAHFLKKDGVLIVNDQSINPMPVITGAAKYPEDIIDKLNGVTKNLDIINALDIAKGIGNIRVANSVLLGVLGRYMDSIEENTWKDALRSTVPEKTISLNLEAFDKGYRP